MKNPWPRAIIAFYGAFIAAVIGFTVFATRQPTDLVSSDYYAREIRHQEQIESDRRGLAATAYLFTSDAPGRRLSLRFPTPGVSGSVLLYRPSDASLDRTLPIQPDTDGTQMIDMSACAPGLWKVHVQWLQDGQAHSREHTVVLP